MVSGTWSTPVRGFGSWGPEGVEGQLVYPGDDGVAGGGGLGTTKDFLGENPVRESRWIPGRVLEDGCPSGITLVFRQLSGEVEEIPGGPWVVRPRSRG